jgi:hypothetical protein
MNYEEARSRIETGDVISVRRKDGFMSKMIRAITRSPYTHSGIAIWLDGGLWMAEINGGHNHLIPLSQLQDIDLDISECPVSRDKVRTAILESLRARANYGMASFVIIGFVNLLKIKERLHSFKDKVCSEYIQAILISAGWDTPDYMASPYDLVKKLTLKFEVRH